MKTSLALPLTPAHELTSWHEKLDQENKQPEISLTTEGPGEDSQGPGEDWAHLEVQGSKLPDARFNKSMANICQDLYRQPGIAFSRACGSKRKAAHRIMSMPQITPQVLLQGHAKSTLQRAQNYPFFLAASDTTTFDFTTHEATTGLGPIATSKTARGFLTHSVLGISPQGTPLGVLYQASWVRDLESYGKSNQRHQRAGVDKESHKWVQALQGVESHLGPEDQVLLIQDREADIFAFLQQPRRETTHLLIRSCHPRRVLLEQTTPPQEKTTPPQEKRNLWDVARSSEVVAQKVLEVKVKKGNEFVSRSADLTIRCTSVEILPPANAKSELPLKSELPNLRIWVICAREETPPEGFAPIEWILLSTFPVLEGQTALDMVRFYSYRWLIERFHFVLKSGFGVERLQFDDADSLMKGLSFYSIVAWRLLYLTYLAREDPDAPASCVFDTLSLEVLSSYKGSVIYRIVDAVATVARLGGFRPCPSAPRAGLKSLWLGLIRLDAMCEGWQMAKRGLPAPTALGMLRDTGQD